MRKNNCIVVSVVFTRLHSVSSTREGVVLTAKIVEKEISSEIVLLEILEY